MPADEILKVEIQSVTSRYSNAEERKRLPWRYPALDSQANYHVIEFNVRNNTNQEQAFRVMSCSYYQHWAVDNKKVHLGPAFVACFRNEAILVTLKPGESYSSVLPIALSGVVPGKTAEFRMSFTPYRKEINKGRYRSLGTFWSNVIKIVGE